jgi:hypothetical protein
LTYDEVGENPPGNGSTRQDTQGLIPAVPVPSSSSIKANDNASTSSRRGDGGLTDMERKGRKLVDMSDISAKWEENLNNIKKNIDLNNVKKNIDQVFNLASSSSSQDDVNEDDYRENNRSTAKETKQSSLLSAADVVASMSAIVVDDTKGSTPGTLTSQQEQNLSRVKQQPMTQKTKNICGIKTTKRAIDDGYTITVCRRLIEDKTRIIMTSKVEFDDPQKKVVEAKQIFERI